MIRPPVLKVAMTKTILVFSILCCLAADSLRAAEPGRTELSAAPQKPLVRVVDLNIGETTQLELCDGQRVEVQLLKLRETRDPIRQAVRSAMVTVKVDGEEITLESGMYNLPRKIAGVQIDCSITKGYNSNGTPSFWGLDKDARLRLWPADSPLLSPGSLIYPVDQRWFATLTWFDNEPVDGGTKILPKIYYHSGLDIGGSERQVKVIAATDAVVVSSGEDVLPEYLLKGGVTAKYGQGKSPVAPRSDVVYLKDGRGWFYRYSHLHKINDAIRPGRIIEQGTEIGLLGKKGASGGWSHLHFEIKSRQPSGKWGTQAGYAFLWEAYRNQYKPELVANTRRKSFLMAGNDATLDGSKSYSATDSIQDYEWTFSDGTTASGPRVTRTYDRPGVFSEILKVTDEAANVDYDFAQVHVLDPKQPDLYVPPIHAAYWPTLGNRVNDPITFKVRSFGNQDGNEVWDFGDGSPAVSVKSDGNAEQQAKEGYAITHHTYEQAGDYLVRVQRSRKDGVTATARLHVRVAAEPPAPSNGKTDSIDESELKERFGEQRFLPKGGFVIKAGQKLPDLVWEHPDLVATVVGDVRIPTRWFNERFEEVEIADQPGRFYAYGEAPVPSGPVLRQAMTCCCVGKDVSLTRLAEKRTSSTLRTGDDDSKRKVDAVVRRWQSTEEGAVELAALLDSGQWANPARRGQWQMENATRQVRLKRKLMGLDDKPLVKITPRLLKGEPAPVLRNAPLTQAGITEGRVQEIESVFDEWYSSSGEPMAVVIARRGVIVLAKGYGKVDGQQVTVDTPMTLDSAMKPLMALQLATYIDRGFVRLDEPIGNYLPDFNTPRDRNLTFRAAHVHVTGIHFPWKLAFSRHFYFHTWHESLIAHCKREWAPGARHRYGVVGIILSVRSLELLRGRNYWDAMERDLFEPLGIRNVLPGGRGFSAESMARIGVLLDNRGKYGKWEVISEETHKAILPTSLKPYFPNVDRKYGIGLQNEGQHLGPGSYGHGGGCGTLLVINPEKHLVFAMVRNDPGKNYREHRSQVMEQLKRWINE